MTARTSLALATLFALPACGEAAGPLPGYVEGEFVAIAAPAAGWVVEMTAQEGDMVAAGDVLVRFDTTREEARFAAAIAARDQAAARLANLKTGARPEELAVIAAQISEAEANLVLAEKDLARQRRLAGTGTGSQQRLDQARAAHDLAAARLQELKRQRTVAELPARAEEIAAAEAALASAEAALAEAVWALQERTIRARVPGRIETRARHAGDFVPAGAILLTLLPQDGIKLRTFVPEPDLPRLAPGATLAVACDGCPDGLTARIIHIAREAEFAPPVLFTRGNRERLVFLIELRPDPSPFGWRPGQPVDVTLPP